MFTREYHEPLVQLPPLPVHRAGHPFLICACQLQQTMNETQEDTCPNSQKSNVEGWSPKGPQ